ncbi:PD-(D/E)XK nuclease family protein, partial [bacterium]|nr:PD-(D/E)XK nuclease family protein [bacterium]
AELPQRRLWLETFLGLVPGLVRVEAERAATWAPRALEAPFELPLAELRRWTDALAAATGEEPAPDLPDRGEPILLRGVVDRIDAHRETGELAVLDYKTGALPTGRAVERLDELQIILYAAAVECGAVAAVAGGPVATGAYYGVHADGQGPPPRPHLPADEAGRRLLARGGAELVRLALGAADPDGAFPLLPREWAGQGPAALPCATCDFRGVCRIEELVVPAATARKLDKLVNRKDPV